MFWTGLITGIFIGVNVGLFIAALLLSAKKNDDADIIDRNIDYTLCKHQTYNIPPCYPEVSIC